MGQTPLPKRSAQALFHRPDETGGAVGHDKHRIGKSPAAHLLQELPAAL